MAFWVKRCVDVHFKQVNLLTVRETLFKEDSEELWRGALLLVLPLGF